MTNDISRLILCLIRHDLCSKDLVRERLPSYIYVCSGCSPAVQVYGRFESHDDQFIVASS